MFTYEQLRQTILQNYVSKFMNPQMKILPIPAVLLTLLNYNIKNYWQYTNTNQLLYQKNNIINSSNGFSINNEPRNIYYPYPALNFSEIMKDNNKKNIAIDSETSPGNVKKINQINENQSNLINHYDLSSACSSKSSNDSRKEKIFDVIYPEQSIKNIYLNYIKDFDNEKNFKIRQRCNKRRKRRENQDNIRKKIKRVFLNSFVLNKINSLLKKGGNCLFFERFPHGFVADVSRKTNSKIINSSIKEILENKELYNDKIAEKNYYHNKRVLTLLEKEKNIELEIFLNMKYSELFAEYLNSDEFKINEIKNLKQKNMEDSYIMRYIYLSKHFIEFFSKI